MKQLLTGKQMKQADTWSIKEFGMESLILMERAALCAAQHIMSVQKPGCVFIMCGMGNNGAGWTGNGKNPLTKRLVC